MPYDIMNQVHCWSLSHSGNIHLNGERFHMFNKRLLNLQKMATKTLIKHLYYHVHLGKDKYYISHMDFYVMYQKIYFL